MAVTDPETTFDLTMIDPSIGEPPLQWPADVDLDQIALSYDHDLDTVYLDLYGRPLPAVNVPLDSGEVGYVDALVGIETNTVVGVEIAAYRTLAVAQHPRWGDLADFIAKSPTSPPGTRRDQSVPSTPGDARRRAALEAVLADVSTLPVYDDSHERSRTP